MKSLVSASVKIGDLNLEQPFEFGAAQLFFLLGSVGNFAFGTALIQMPNLSCAKPIA